MGKRIILSENEKLSIQSLYKGLLNEQEKVVSPPMTDAPPKKEVPVKKILTNC